MILDLVWPGAGERLVYGDLKPRADRTWVRITKDQLNLIPMQLDTETVALDPVHRQIYELVTAEVRELEASGLLDERPDLRHRAVMRMLAVATNPALLVSPAEHELAWDDAARGIAQTVRTDRELHALVSKARPAKLARVSEIMRDHGREDRKLLVWTNFLGNVFEVSRLLAAYRPAVITGATPVEDASAPTDRARELNRFRNDPDCEVLIATPQTLGEGISLHRACQSQVHLDRSFNAGLYLQALDRTHRVSMPPGTQATTLALIAEGTIDERVQRVLTDEIAAMYTALADPTLRTLELPDVRDDGSLSEDEEASVPLPLDDPLN